MAISTMLLDNMITKKTLELRTAKTETEKADAMNDLDQLIALRKDLNEAHGEGFYQMATLAVTAFGVVAPLVVNTRLIRDCIQFEHTGAWSHPTIRNLVNKIKIGK